MSALYLHRALHGSGAKGAARLALIRASVEVLRPLVYSETPQPSVQRRWQGDGKSLAQADLVIPPPDPATQEAFDL